MQPGCGFIAKFISKTWNPRELYLQIQEEICCSSFATYWIWRFSTIL